MLTSYFFVKARQEHEFVAKSRTKRGLNVAFLVTPVQSLTVKAFFRENLVTILKALLAMNDGSCLSSV